jgi:hypothetical protein
MTWPIGKGVKLEIYFLSEGVGSNITGFILFLANREKFKH